MVLAKQYTKMQSLQEIRNSICANCDQSKSGGKNKVNIKRQKLFNDNKLKRQIKEKKMQMMLRYKKELSP